MVPLPRKSGGGIIFALLAIGAAPPPEPVDLLIRAGTVYTGSAEPFTGDVAIAGDRIRAVGRRLAGPARRVIDARRMVVAPGFIETDMTAVLPEETRKAYQSAIPAGRFATPAEVAATVRFLASTDAAYISGAVIPVDGGMTRFLL